MEGGCLIEGGAYEVFLSTNCNLILAKSTTTLQLELTK